MANYSGNEGTPISKADGQTLTGRFQTNFPNEKKGYFFGRNHLLDILAQDECKGIRVYFGQDIKEGVPDKITLVLVGADGNGDDQSRAGDKILDYGDPCPSNCSAPSEAVG